MTWQTTVARQVRTNKLAILSLVLCPLLVAPAQADSIPFSWSLISSTNPNAIGDSDTRETLNTTPPSPAADSYAQSGSWGDVAAYAAADLAAGTLKVRAAADYSGGAQIPPYTQVNALFGDSFSTSIGGSPFQWDGTTATFQMDLSGSLRTGGSITSAVGFAVLSILKKGTLDPAKPVIGTADVIQYFAYQFGNPYTTILYNHPDTGIILLDHVIAYAGLPSEIDATFAPGGDFDWVLLLGASGWNVLPSSFDIDLSHTVTLSYIAPAGTTTVAASGLFANISTIDVAEPFAFPVFMMGAGGMIAIRRRARRPLCG